MPNVTWVLEPDIFPETHGPIRNAIRDRGLRLVEWSDAWWTDGVPSNIPTSCVVFHGSLGNASRIANELQWKPGSFCPVQSFLCSSWYKSARQWLVHTDWIVCAASELVANASKIAEQLGETDRLFVRPDSPLKPFSGRVVDIATLTLEKLDHGFYYDDESIPVVAAPIQAIGNEWRFVVVNRCVITGSAYDPQTRRPVIVPLDSASVSVPAKMSTRISAKSWPAGIG
jgi:hypothetical protein